MVRGLQLNGNNSLILRPIWQNFFLSVSVADYGNNLLKVNEYHTEKISFSLLKHGLQDGRGFIIKTIQLTHWFSVLNSNSKYKQYLNAVIANNWK